MAKNKHHYVPQFYLRNFASEPRRINLFNLRRDFSCHNAGLRDQCHRHKFYGKEDNVEDFLSRLESDAAILICRIIEEKVLPPYEDDAFILLMMFIAIQMQRTSATANKLNLTTEKLIKRVNQEDPSLAEIEPESYTVGYKNPALVSLQYAQEIAYCLDDLSLHLVCTEKERRFITSDNPVFKYNQYCERLKGMGTTGAISRGLQIFLPLSPHILLILYDSAVYKVGDGKSIVTTKLTSGELSKLNLMQLVGAEEQVYFSNWKDLQSVEDLARRAKRYRQQEVVRLQEFEEEGGERSLLLHSYEPIPNIELALSFMTIHANARRIPLHQRIRPFRREISDVLGEQTHYRPPIRSGTIFKRREKK